MQSGLSNQEETPMVTLILLLVLLVAIGGAGWNHSRWGYAGWSPAAVILVVVAVLWFTGNLHG
jgi:Protein of unknown function (DUF3309)